MWQPFNGYTVYNKSPVNWKSVMKKGSIVILLLCVATVSNAQTWDEWFRQTQTQVRYLVEQISALKVYAGTVERGYNLVNDGLQQIGQLKESEWRLHEEHFSSLLTVKNGIKESQSFRQIHSLKAATERVSNVCKKRLENDGVFSDAEKAYFVRVLDRTLLQSKIIEAEAVLLTSDHQYQLQDGERLQRLLVLSADMDEVYEFSQHFRADLSITAFNRLKEQMGVRTLKPLF
jgi:hypothetical protein